MTDALLEAAIALEKIEKQFTSYAEHHKTKGDAGKAATNCEYALLAGRALERIRRLTAPKAADGRPLNYDNGRANAMREAAAWLRDAASLYVSKSVEWKCFHGAANFMTRRAEEIDDAR